MLFKAPARRPETDYFLSRPYMSLKVKEKYHCEANQKFQNSDLVLITNDNTQYLAVCVSILNIFLTNL